MDCRTDQRARSGIISSLSKGKVCSTVQSWEGPTVTDPSTFLDHPSSGAEPTKKIMSFELAMKRELAYRRKMELLTSQTTSNSRQGPLPSQTLTNSEQDLVLSKDASQHPSLVGMKRKRPSSNEQHLPPQQRKPSCPLQPLQKQSFNLTCKICQVPCSGPFNLKQHLSGSKHKAKLKELEECQKNGEENATKLLWCELCGVPCMNAHCLQQHLTGKKHLAHLQAIEDLKNMSEEAEAVKFQLKNMQWEMIG